MTKTLNQIFFPPPKLEYFFQQQLGIRIFFQKWKDRQHNDQNTKGLIRSRKWKNRQYNDQNTKGVIRSRKLKDRQCNDQKCENTKGVIRSRKLKDSQYNDQNTKGVIRSRKWKDRQWPCKENGKRTYNNIHNITQKIKD